MIYPKGTNISEIRHFDRSTKVTFACSEHMEIHYRSKDPFSSNWFPANELANQIGFGIEEDPCAHTFKNHGEWLTTEDYDDGEDEGHIRDYPVTD